MHRKFRQGSHEPLKDFSLGQPSLDDIQCYPKTNFYTKSSSKSQRDNLLRKSFAGPDGDRADEEDFEEESSAALTELFHGFLAIGTLGGDPIVNDPSTPTFSISVENIAEKETEVTENDLKLINDELEKVLGVEAKDDISSGRSSQVSAGRSSHCSTITLSGKQLESLDNSANIGTNICPLQGYLFGSAIGLPDTTIAKKEPRPSLGELFQKTKLADENSGGAKYDRGEKRMDKEHDKSAVHLVKKILKKGMPHASSKSSTAASGCTIDSAAAETKLHKILHMFHRKVHPESTATAEKLDKPSKNEIRNNLMYDGAYNLGGAEDVALVPKRRMSKESIRRLKSQSNMHQFTISAADCNGNRECWIKSDADCKSSHFDLHNIFCHHLHFHIISVL
nr:Protein LAZY 1 [Ipomoea batatas]